MSIQTRICQWSLKMGYYENLCHSVGNLYNNSTSFIWDDILENVRPKLEVENVRNNLIIHRLQSKYLQMQFEYPSPIKEIDLYKRRKDLQEQIHARQMCLGYKKYNLECASQNNNLKYVTTDYLRYKIENDKLKTHLLKRRFSILCKSVHEVEQYLSLIKRLMHIESEENCTKYVGDTLRSCIEKLEIMPHNLILESRQYTSINAKQIFGSIQKMQSTFENHLYLSEEKGRSVSRAFRKKNTESNKESSNKVNRVLFDFDRNPDGNAEYKKQHERESLGILPDFTCQESAFFLEPEGSPVHCKNHCKSTFDIFQEWPQNGSFFIQQLNHTTYVPTSHPKTECIQKEMDEYNLQELYRNSCIKSLMSQLIHTFPMQMILGIIKNEIEALDLEAVTQNICNMSVSEHEIRFSEDDLANLQLIHIQKNFQIMTQNRCILHLKNKALKQKRDIHDLLASKGLVNDRCFNIEKTFDYQLMEFGLNALLNAMKNEIHLLSKDENDLTEVDRIYTRALRIEKDISEHHRAMLQLKNMIKKIYKSIFVTRRHTTAQVERLMPYMMEMTWTQILSKNACIAELIFFIKHQLGFESKKKILNSATGTCPENINMDSKDLEDLSMICSILKHPFQTLEIILLDSLKLKESSNSLKQLLQSKSGNRKLKKCTSTELQLQESYIEYILDKFCSGVYSSCSNKAMVTASELRTITDIWVEMPVRIFISGKRILKGYDYLFYERQFDNFYVRL